MRTKVWADENIIYQTNQHWMIHDKIIALMMLVWLASLFFFLKAPHLFLKIKTAMIVVNILAGLVIVWFEIARRYNIWVVTNKRIIDEWGVLTRGYKELAIDKINNISYEQSIVGRMLKFGTVSIQTAASQGTIAYRMIKDPQYLVSAITSTIERSKLQGGITNKKKVSNEETTTGITEPPAAAVPGVGSEPVDLLDMAMPGVSPKR